MGEGVCGVREWDEMFLAARYVVLYARANTRKHKKWEGDGFLTLSPTGEIELTEETGRELAKSSVTAKKRLELCDGYIFNVGGYEVEIQELLEETAEPSSASLHVRSPLQVRAETVPSRPAFPSLPKRPLLPARGVEGERSPISPPAKRALMSPCSLSLSSSLSHARKPFSSPLVQDGARDEPPFLLNPQEVERGVESAVAVEGRIAKHLREHQREGVLFIYQRLKCSGGGAILADEMGLGKSVQTLAATWALLTRKRDVRGEEVSRCLLVVPSSLLNNWRAEVTKWFKGTRIPAMVVKKASDISCFMTAHKVTPYLIISYDMALRCAPQLAACRFHILVCDEGHRVKNVNGKLREALNSLAVQRRLLLTGTPIQNDLDELFSIVDFVQPGCLGSVGEFRSLCKRQEEGTEEDGEDVNAIIARLMLRRTSEVNRRSLPEKHEYVFFCAPSPLQRRVLEAVGDHMTGDPLVLIDLMRKACNHPAILYKHLLKGDADQQQRRVTYASITGVYPSGYGDRPAGIADSGKLSVLTEMLNAFRVRGECTVVVSQYTKTLDMIALLASSLAFTIFRLDGQTAVAGRQSLVDSFNQSRDANNLFLLSSKAGGVGLNLIGASRLILFDMDWNPSNDVQAMARIWREGQPRACHIYRLATTGTIDEKILQRQMKKTGLSSIIDVDSLAHEKLSFRDEDLADIFCVHETECNTHDLLECGCGGKGLLPLEMEDDEDSELSSHGVHGDEESTAEEEGDENAGDPSQPECEEDEEEGGDALTGPASMAELFRWRHYSPSSEDTWNLLKTQASLGNSALRELTFAFHYSAAF